MKGKSKTGILALLLVMPVFVYFGLKLFGKNYYALPIFFATDSTIVDGRYKITNSHTVPAFSFVNQDGKSFTDKDLKGLIYVADFFFTRCPGICPKMTNQLTRVQEVFTDNNDIKLVSFTVDPGNDTVQALKVYANAYKAKEGKWNFLNCPRLRNWQLPGR